MTYSKPTCTASYQLQLNSAKSGLKFKQVRLHGDDDDDEEIKSSHMPVCHFTDVILLSENVIHQVNHKNP